MFLKDILYQVCKCECLFFCFVLAWDTEFFKNKFLDFSQRHLASLPFLNSYVCGGREIWVSYSSVFLISLLVLYLYDIKDQSVIVNPVTEWDDHHHPVTGSTSLKMSTLCLRFFFVSSWIPLIDFWDFLFG